MIGKLRKANRPLRIAIGRVFHEANSYSPLPTDRASFESIHFFRGEDVLRIASPREIELVGFLRKAELTGFVTEAERDGNVECVPLISALAVPSGPLSMECFEWLRDELCASLRAAGDVDGVYLALHGSMRVAGLDTAPEGALIAAVREIVGDKPIAVSYDLHANLSPSIVDTVTIVEGYRTNPHRDLCRTGRRAGAQLIATLRGEIRPQRAWRKLPILLGGGTTIDFLHPMRSIFLHIARLVRRRGVVSAHVFMVHPFTDADDLGWAVQVTTDGDAALAERLVDELAERVWKVRKVPLPTMRTPQEAIRDVRAARLARKLGQVSLVDTSDIVGAGSTGGCTHLLEALVEQGADLKVFLPLHDPAAVAELWSCAPGERTSVVARGTAALSDQPAVELNGVVETKAETEFGRTVVFRHGELRIALSEKPPGSLHPRFWTQLGLSPWQADAVVQKFFFHYRIYYVASVRRNIPVVSAGPSSLDNVRKRAFDLPIWPQQPVEEWRSFDRARRHASAPN